MGMFTLLMLYAICFIPTLVILPLFPYLTRKNLSFGITIPEELFNESRIKGIRDHYRNSVLISLGVIALAALAGVITLPIEISFLIIVIGIFVQLIPVNIFYLISHFKMKELKKEDKWAVDRAQVVMVETDLRTKRIIASPWWFALYGFIILATLAIGFFVYNRLPDMLPMHYNINGEVDRWAAKSYKVLVQLPIIQAFLALLMYFVYLIIGKSKQQIDAANPEKSVAQNRIFRYRWSMFIVFTGMAIITMFGFIQLTILGLIPASSILPISLMIPGGILVGTIVLSITTGQSGSRITSVKVKDGSGQTEKVISRDDDRYWKLGAFYYNPEDPSLFVEKRFGIGWDLNWARPLSWVIMLGLLAVPVLIVVISITLS